VHASPSTAPPPNQRTIAIEGSASDCNVRLALGKIECPLHDQLDREARMPRMKAVEEAGFDDALTDHYVAGRLDQAGGAVVECCRLALQCIDGGCNVFCMDQQLLTVHGLSFSKRAVERRFESPQAALNGRLIYAQDLCSGTGAATARDSVTERLGSQISTTWLEVHRRRRRDRVPGRSPCVSSARGPAPFRSR
jgi:hypothetical protein